MTRDRRAKRPRRRPGAVPGIPTTMTEAARKQRQTANLQHGLRAQVVTREEALQYRLERIHPDAANIIDAYIQAHAGDPDALNRDTVRALAEIALIRRDVVDEIFERGVLIQDAILDRDGKEIAGRLRANPALQHLKWTDEHLGCTADQMELTRRSRKDAGLTDDMIAQSLLRDARLRAADKSKLPPPPDFLPEDEER